MGGRSRRAEGKEEADGEGWQPVGTGKGVRSLTLIRDRWFLQRSKRATATAIPSQQPGLAATAEPASKTRQEDY